MWERPFPESITTPLSTLWSRLSPLVPPGIEHDAIRTQMDPVFLRSKLRNSRGKNSRTSNGQLPRLRSSSAFFRGSIERRKPDLRERIAPSGPSTLVTRFFVITIAGAMTISESLLPEFDVEMEIRGSCLAAFPDSKWDWKPHPKVNVSRRALGSRCGYGRMGSRHDREGLAGFGPGDFKPYIPESV